MQALPDQLAAGLDVCLAAPVRSVRPTPAGQVVHTDDGPVRARAVVVAVGPESVARLTPLPAPATQGLRTWWFAADALPAHPAFLRVDGRGPGAGPVVNSVALTAVAPAYAPPGQHLVQATSLLPDAAPEPEVRRHLADLHGIPTDGWSLVTRHDLPHALPAQPPPTDVRRPVDLGGGLFVAGDHRDTGSLQGALASGTRAARAVETHLAGAR
jgi:hypothetical protein